MSKADLEPLDADILKRIEPSFRERQVIFAAAHSGWELLGKTPAELAGLDAGQAERLTVRLESAEALYSAYGTIVRQAAERLRAARAA